MTIHINPTNVDPRIVSMDAVVEETLMALAQAFSQKRSNRRCRSSTSIRLSV